VTDALSDRELRDLAVKGDRRGVRLFIDRTGSVVEARVARALARRAEGRDLHGDILDLVQEVYVVLFSDRAKVLRTWDPARGASLANFVGIIAERTCASVLRRKRTDPYRDSPEDWDSLEARLETTSMEGGVVSRDFGARLLEILRAELSPQGMELFLRLFIEGGDPTVVAEEMKMSRDAVYAWKSRLQKILRARARTLDPSSGSLGVARPQETT
jgi:RNA polymerase sigma-70 factor (ECF subfamily)